MSKDSNKKYYWLKLKDNFFEDDTIQFIEEQENGKEYVIFYLKLCLKSLTKNGKLFRLVGDKIIPYDVKSLARLTNTNVDTVNTAMQLFKEIGIIDVLDGGELYLCQIDEMIGSETNKAQLMREKRARLKLEKKGGNNVTEMLPHIEKELEKDKELDKDIESKQKKFKKPTIEEIQSYCQERNNTVDAQRFFDYYESKGWLIGKNKMKDWKAAIRTWERNSFNQPSKPFKNTCDYQGEITEEELRQYDR